MKKDQKLEPVGYLDKWQHAKISMVILWRDVVRLPGTPSTSALVHLGSYNVLETQELNGTSGGITRKFGDTDCTNQNSLSFWRFSEALHNLCAQMEGLENSPWSECSECSDRSCVTWVAEAFFPAGAAGYGCQWQLQLDLLARFSTVLHVSPSPHFGDHKIMYRSQYI